MEFIFIFFILSSIGLLIYFTSIFNSKKRFPVLFEIFSILFYLVILIIFLFPNILNFIEELLGIQSAINFLIYLSIFVSYFILFILYKKSEEQRIEITTLVREIAYLKEKKK